MARREKTVPDGPLADLANGLRALRVAAGITYRELADRSQYSISVLSAAAGGERLPTWDVTRAYVTACGGTPKDLEEWKRRWNDAKQRYNQDQSALQTQTPANQQLDTRATAARDERAEFAVRLNDLRRQVGMPTLRTIARATYSGSRRPLAMATVADLLKDTSHLPRWETVSSFVEACVSLASDNNPPAFNGLDDLTRWRQWHAALERSFELNREGEHQATGKVRVRAARARLLGVHAAIRSHDTGGYESSWDELPTYVPRDLDPLLRTAIAAAAERGGFVLLTGGSATGKTRTLFEAVRTVLPEWWLVHPQTADEVRTLADGPIRQTVVWLDELQNYLDHDAGLPVATIRRLISAGAMVVATLWPVEYVTRTAPRAPGQPDRYANDRQLLGLAEVVQVPGEFSPPERRRAEELAADPRIRIALDTSDVGFAQVLAAGPALISRWEQAPCYGKAVITAAMDARRLGATAPLPAEFLAAAAPGYLTSAEQATASEDWFETALTYATMPLHGGTSALTPIPAGMGRIAGYKVSDYLYQHTRPVRDDVHVPETTRQALILHHHPGDTLLPLTINTERTDHYQEAELLIRQTTSGAHNWATKLRGITHSTVIIVVAVKGSPDKTLVFFVTQPAHPGKSKAVTSEYLYIDGKTVETLKHLLSQDQWHEVTAALHDLAGRRFADNENVPPALLHTYPVVTWRNDDEPK